MDAEDLVNSGDYEDLYDDVMSSSVEVVAVIEIDEYGNPVER